MTTASTPCIRTPASTQHIVDNVDNKGLTPTRTGSIRRVGASPQERFSAIFGEKVRLASLSPHRHSPRAQSLRLFPGENGAPRMLEQIKQFLLHYFTWWNGANFNTRFYTRRFGVLVGHDEFGNAYYRRPGIDPALGFERRWVIYNGVSEASMTPPGWNGWLHHTVDVAPTEEDYKSHPWEKPHMGNPTGTPAAIRPDGSTLRAGPRQPTGGDYEAWNPGP
jgi:NADH:ubiquinone oxidoreductase subunit